MTAAAVPGLLFAVILAVALAFGFFQPPGHKESNSAAARPRIKTIAVLPFRPLTAEATDETLGPGMADALITRLSRNTEITVRPTSAILKYNKAGQDPIAAGREQRVDALLDGCIQREGDRISVSAQLIRVSDGATLWADNFDEKLTDIFSIQNEISEKLASALALRLTASERKLPPNPGTSKVEAYQAYVRGRYFWNKRRADGFRKAIEYFQQAIDKDPAYAQAYAGLADAYLLLRGYRAANPQDAIPQARAAAERALQLDETLAEAHTSLGLIAENYDWDWPKPKGTTGRPSS